MRCVKDRPKFSDDSGKNSKPIIILVEQANKPIAQRAAACTTTRIFSHMINK